jgi:hypothetical protein
MARPGKTGEFAVAERFDDRLCSLDHNLPPNFAGPAASQRGIAVDVLTATGDALDCLHVLEMKRVV